MSRKIIGIIACQILLIVASYLILVFFENQSTYLGNTINISGKNRFLGESLYQETINHVLTGNQNPPLDIVKNIDNITNTLLHGGIVFDDVTATSQNEITIIAVPSKFSHDLNTLSNNWNIYKTDIMSEMYPTKNKNILNDQSLEDHKSRFITSADQVTNDLSDYSKELVRDMTTLQLTLLGINVTVHLLLLGIIFRLIRKEQTEKILLQQISEKNKKLEFESKFALLQKDISQSFISDMEDKLYEINQQVNLIHQNKGHETNSVVVRDIFQSLFVKIQQLAQSRIELENKTSYYEQLIKKLRNSIFTLSKSNNDLDKVENPREIVTIIESYIDIVNLMIYEQIIPSKLGKNLTDALNDIIDHMTFGTSKESQS